MTANVTTPAVARSVRTLSQPLWDPLIALTIAVFLGALLVLFLGENPIEVYSILIQGSLGGWPNISVTLQMTTPLLFTGLAVAMSFRAGLWNIGAEGQMLIGALAGGIVGYALPIPAALHLPACLLAAFVGGLAWSIIPAILRVNFHVNEIVVYLMMNPIALLVASYVSTHLLKAPGPTNKLPDIIGSASLPGYSAYSQLNAGILIGLACCVAVAFLNRTTVLGYEWKMMGRNPRFAHYGGVDVRRNALAIMLGSGGIAGLAGAEQVLGQYGAFYDGFSPGYGFTGIAVAMLAKSNPLGVILAAFLFGALNSGGSVLQMATGLNQHFVQVLQFLIVLILAAQFSWKWLRKREAQQSDAS